MGNYVSCSLSSPLSKNSSTKVILPDGEIRQIRAPTKAAELMLEIPNHFLVDAKSLKIGKRYSPLNADDDLELGSSCHVYVMLPMTRVSSAANASDMARLFLAAKNRASKVRISPAAGGEGSAEGDDIRLVSAAAVPKLKLEEIENFAAPEFIMHRISVSKSKKPLLETIKEESVSSR